MWHRHLPRVESTVNKEMASPMAQSRTQFGPSKQSFAVHSRGCAEKPLNDIARKLTGFQSRCIGIRSDLRRRRRPALLAPVARNGWEAAFSSPLVGAACWLAEV